MFEVTTYPLNMFEDEIRSEFTDSELGQLSGLFAEVAPATSLEPPWVQLAYSEISQDFLATTLSYAQIADTNFPVGVDAAFSPIHREQEIVIFPISGLEAHLESMHPSQIAVLREAGEPSRFLAGTHEYPDATEFFLAGLLACAAFAKEHRQAIVFRW